MVEAAVSALGKDDPRDWPPTDMVAEARCRLAHVVGAVDTEPVADGLLATDVRPGLLSAWRAAAGDPDDQPEIWFRHGAPAGIRHFPEPRGIFPVVDDDAEDPELIATETNFGNAVEVDSDASALEIFEEHAKKGYVASFATVDEAERFLGTMFRERSSGTFCET